MAKGIRVNQLAKELGVESKAILAKCREEGLGEKVPNHMTVLSIGLSETVREWFRGMSSEGGGTAVETAPPVEAKPKRARTTKKKATELKTPDLDEVHEELQADAETPATEPETVTEAEAPAPIEPPAKPAAVVEAPAAVEPPPAPEVKIAPMKPAPRPPVKLEAPEHAPHAPKIPPAVVHPAPPAAPSTAAAAASSPTAHPAPSRPAGPTARPTVSLRSHQAPPPPIERKSVTPAPQLTSLQPAKIQGPRVVREEAPEVVPVPRAPRRPQAGGEAPAFTQARPQQGRGVKVSEEEEESEAKKKSAKGGAAGRTNSNRRRGPDGRRGEALEKLREFTEADLEERRIRLNRASGDRAQREWHLAKTQQRPGQIAKTGAQKGEPIKIEEPITIKGLSSVLGIKSNDLLLRLLKQGVSANLNQTLDHDSAMALALEYGVELQVAQKATLEEQLVSEMGDHPSQPENLVARPPVVTILGHVDHGKTSLLDRIRKANVAAGEAGGITQHTAAWMVQLGQGEDAKRVTFIDTPGHQAFTSMRARGANMTDVVVLVVSAAEGVQPQTIESINHAKAANVPIVVAMNKIDRPDANEQMVLGQLANHGLNPVEWSGDIEVVRTSAVTGQGIEELIEILDYQSQLLDLKTDPTAPARGTVIEARMDPGMGSVATVLVQDGTLRPGDVILAGPGYGRVRSLLNDRGENVETATASMPVLISGMSDVPAAGDNVYQLDDMERARAIAEERGSAIRQQQLAGRTAVTRDNLTDVIRAGEIKTIHLIIKADVQGSVETLAKTVTDMNTEEVRVKVMHSGVGPISESDVELAMATRVNAEDKDHPNNVAIIGFHVVAEEAARVKAEQNHIDIKLYRVIYEIFDDLKKALSGMLEPEIREKLHGHAEVRQVFKVSRIGNIAGCLVTDGHIQRGSRIRLTRGGVVVTEDLSIDSLKRLKDDVREVKSGLECGIKLANYDDIKVGDVFEAYVRETIQRTL